MDVKSLFLDNVFVELLRSNVKYEAVQGSNSCSLDASMLEAASTMIFATASGWEWNGTWLAGSSKTFLAPIRFAMKRSKSELSGDEYQNIPEYVLRFHMTSG
jgi:hypothetical protein